MSAERHSDALVSRNSAVFKQCETCNEPELLLPVGKCKHVTKPGEVCTRTECYISKDKPADYWYFVRSSLSSQTSLPKLVLIGFGIWYIVVISLVGIETWKPIINGAVIMVLIGLLLNFNAFDAFRQAAASCPNLANDPTAGTLKKYIEIGWSGALRLFIVPFCVASYSGVAAGNPNFIIVFPTVFRVWFPAIVLSVCIPLIMYWKQRLAARLIKDYELNAARRDSKRDSHMGGQLKKLLKEVNIRDEDDEEKTEKTSLLE